MFDDMEHSNGIDRLLLAEQAAAALECSGGGVDSMGMEGKGSEGSCVLSRNVPRVEVKLFAGRIPREYSEQDVRALFEKYGEVLDVIIIRDKGTGMHKGSAFVRMKSMADADAAIRDLDNRKVLDPSLAAMQVKYATGELEKLCMPERCGVGGVDQAKLFIGSLPKAITKEQVNEIFEPFGNIDEIYLMKDTSTGSGKGCAFVKYHFKEEALHAIRSLDGKITVPGCTRPIEVRFAMEDKEKVAIKQAQGVGPYGPTPGQFGGGGATSSPYGNPMYPPTSMGGLTAPVEQPWKEYFTPEGRAYYHHERAGITQWERPLEFCPSGVGARESGPPGSNLFVFHWPHDSGHDELYKAFSAFGHIRSARVASDHTGKNRGFAFVSFENPQSAALALAHMNGSVAKGGKRLKVSIKKGEEAHAAAVPAAAVAPSHMGPPMATPYVAQPVVAQQQYGAYGYAGNRYAPY